MGLTARVLAPSASRVAAYKVAAQNSEDVSSRLRAWSATVATVAAWPSAEPVQPTIERAIIRTRATGRLHEYLFASLVDHVGTSTPADVARELHELLRPLRVLGLRTLNARESCEVATSELRYAAEIDQIDADLPASAPLLVVLFDQLIAGLADLDGPVMLAIAIAPHHERSARLENSDGGDVNESACRWRQVRFRLRLSATAPLPAVMLARAESMLLASGCGSDDPWRLPPDEIAATRAAPSQRLVNGWDCESSPPARADAAALLLALPVRQRPRRTDPAGSLVEGPLSSGGAALGRVLRPDGRQARWRLSWEARRTNTFVAGASGCGKTTALLRLASDDLAARRSVVVLDLHGALADDVAALAGWATMLRVDPTRAASDPLDLLDRDPGVACAHLVSAVTEVWGQELEGSVAQHGILLALRVLASRAPARAASLAEVVRYLLDADWRDRLIADIDGALAADAVRESRAWRNAPAGDTSIVSLMASTLTPLTHGPASSLFGVPGTRPIEAELIPGGVVVVSLPIGALGADTAGMLGRMFLARLTTAVAARAESRPAEVSVIIDEAQFVAGQALTDLVAQARKSRASITLATQSPRQLGDQLTAILTNVQNLILGRMPLQEAFEFGARLGEDTLTVLPALPRHHLVVATEEVDPSQPPLVLSPVPTPDAPKRRDALHDEHRAREVGSAGESLR